VSIRVLFWSERFWPIEGGIAVVSSRLLPRLAERGHEIQIVTETHPGRPETDAIERLPILRLPLRSSLAGREPGRILGVLKTLRALIARFRPELVHVFFVGPSVFLLRQVTAGIPTLVSLDSASLAGEAELFDDTLRAARWVTCVSRARLSALRERLPELADRTSLLSRAAPDWTPSARGVPTDPPRFLCCGRLEAVKRFDLAIEAFARFAAERPDATLTLAGEGSCRPALEALAERLDIQAKITFLGHVAPSDIPALMETATAVVLPSDDEGTPGVLLEAATLGRPVVATRVGSVPELFPSSDHGLLVSPGDADALTDALFQIVREPERARAMGLHASEHVRATFPMADQVSACEQLYRRLVS
jgi:glycosyltransferase involved in cell wall biosynthesis